LLKWIDIVATIFTPPSTKVKKSIVRRDWPWTEHFCTLHLSGVDLLHCKVSETTKAKSGEVKEVVNDNQHNDHHNDNNNTTTSSVVLTSLLQPTDRQLPG